MKNFIGNITTSEMTMKRKAVTLRSWANKILRTPRRVTFLTLSTGVVIETQYYGNCRIIKTY